MLSKVFRRSILLGSNWVRVIEQGRGAGDINVSECHVRISALELNSKRIGITDNSPFEETCILAMPNEIKFS